MRVLGYLSEALYDVSFWHCFLFVFLVFVTEFPLDQDLFVGRSQVIRCSAEGYPKPTFKWYKNRRLVKFSDPRFTLLSNGSLLINPVHETDTAEYICRITQLGTEEGTNLREESKDIQVTVYGTYVLLLLNYTCKPTVPWGVGAIVTRSKCCNNVLSWTFVGISRGGMLAEWLERWFSDREVGVRIDH